MSARLRFLFAPTLLLVLLAAACSGSASGSTASTSTPITVGSPSPADGAASLATPGLTPGPFKLDPPGPDGQRIYDLDKALSVSIGPRPAGTAKEKEAADYIAGLLRSFGYDVHLQQFPIGEDIARTSDITVTSPQQQTVVSVPLANSGAGNASGRLVDGGLGRPEDIPADAKGAIVLIQRGDLTFQQKVENATNAGAIGVIIYNNEGSTFYGTLSSASSIPALSTSQEDGKALQKLLDAGDVTVDMSLGTLSDASSYNVIATPPGKDCQTISSGHYDSVQIAPGASDNGSGAATVIEMAAVIADRGEMGNNCFILWGAEELGLVGSQAYVSSMTPQQKSDLKAMLNFDMVGVGENGWQVIGSADLQREAIAAAAKAGIDAVPAELPPNASSDHASFIQAGMQAVLIHRSEDPLLHTPQDVIDRVQPDLLEQAARMGLALLQALNGSA